MSEKRIMVEAELVDLAEPWTELERPVLRHRLSYSARGGSVAWAPATLRLHPAHRGGPDPLRLSGETPFTLRALAGVAFCVAALVLFSTTF